ncbi:MAG: ArnT family glycosyltransferase [Novipirellula sp. JB048]
MLDWALQKRSRFGVLLLAYFGLHVIVRVALSGALDYDEAEQVFLSQWLSLGYNSQPPLYTWMQTGLFQLFGYGVMPLALLKNTLLLLTYLSVFGMVNKVTGSAAMSWAASLAMMTIPQIAWESHRDLSHSVAVTFAVSLLMYCVVSLRHQPHWKWYVAIGLSCGFGLLSKYNFAIVILAVMGSAITVPSYRRWLLDRRLLLSLLVAVIVVSPHLYWASGHLQLASSKTIATLTTAQTDHYAVNVARGLYALFTSTLACTVLTLVIVAVAFRDSLKNRFLKNGLNQGESRSVATDPSVLLLERSLLLIGVMLTLLVLSGHGLEFKNRWIQPFVCLFPAYLILRWGHLAAADRVALNRVCLTGVTFMAVVLIAVIARPISAQRRNEVTWLNIPYPTFAQSIVEQTGRVPTIIIAPHTHAAGNLKLQFPSARVVAMDQRHLVDPQSLLEIMARGDQDVIVATDRLTRIDYQYLSEFAIEMVGQPTDRVAWQHDEYRCLYGDASATMTLSFARLEQGVDPIAAREAPVSASDRTAILPSGSVLH